MKNIGKDIEIAAKKINEGNLVVFPTETVYGIGANALDEEAVKKIFIAKNRPQDNPLIVHVNSLDMVEKLTNNISEIEKKLMNKFWPGPLSIVLEKSELVPYIVTAGLDTVSIRMPDNKFALDLIEKAKVPIAAPSANKSGKPSGTNILDIYDELKENVSYFLDGGKCEIGIESTVVKVEKSGKIVILRPGKITKEQLSAISDVEVDKNCFRKVSKDEKVLSPGMKHRHYAPNAKCIMINFDDKEKMIKKIREISVNSDQNIAFMVMDDIAKNIKENVKIYNLGTSLEDVSKNIFNYLRNLDKNKIDLCYIQGFDTAGLGLGIMNRLLRACEYNVIQI